MPDIKTPDGLIHALLLDGKGGKKPLSFDKVDQWEPAKGCLWLHFNYTDPESREWLENSSGLNEIAVSALLSEETRPRSLNRSDALLLSLRGVNLSPGQWQVCRIVTNLARDE